jgi:branched-chain amino acid transport system permease protein
MKLRAGLLLAAFAALLVLPALAPVTWMRLATETIMWACIALSWNLLGGYTGYLNFGVAAFFGLGAYVTGILMTKAGMPFAFALPLAGVAGALLAFLLGLPTLRLRGAYFAIATWAFAEAMRQIALLAEPLTGGSEGLRFVALDDNRPFYYLMLALLVVTLLVLYWMLKRSKLGYWLVAIREHEDVATAMGIDVVRVKLFVFTISGIVPALAGGIYGYWITIINPNEVFKALISDNGVVMSLFGGLGTFWGPVVGAIIVNVGGRLMWLSWGSDVGYIVILGLAVCLVALFIPEGIVGLFQKRRSGSAYAPNPKAQPERSA